MEQYWVIEAKWENKKGELKDKILSRGYWYLNYSDSIKALFENSQSVMQSGDKIAIKECSENSDNKPKIKAIGIIKAIDENNKVICVDWILEEVKREKFGLGECNSLQGPFFEKEDWVKHLLESI